MCAAQALLADLLEEPIGQLLEIVDVDLALGKASALVAFIVVMPDLAGPRRDRADQVDASSCRCALLAAPRWWQLAAVIAAAIGLKSLPDPFNR